MQLSQDPIVATQLQKAIDNQLTSFDFDGVTIWHMYRFYDFLNSAGAKGYFDEYVLDLIEQYFEIEPGKYDYRLNNHRVSFYLEESLDLIDQTESIAIRF